MRIGFVSALVALIAASVLAFAQAPQPDPKDPQYQAKGDQKRTYPFPGTGETIPYHLYVPSKWSKGSQLPLVVVTHGASQPADAPFQRGDGALAKIAEERGYVVVAVTGYKPQATVVEGGYNNPFKMVPAPRPTGTPAAAGAGYSRRLPAKRARHSVCYRSCRERVQHRPKPHVFDGQLCWWWCHMVSRSEVSRTLDGNLTKCRTAHARRVSIREIEEHSCTCRSRRSGHHDVV